MKKDINAVMVVRDEILVLIRVCRTMNSVKNADGGN